MGVLPRSHSLVLVSLRPKPTLTEAIAPNALQQIKIERHNLNPSSLLPFALSRSRVRNKEESETKT